MTLGDIDIADRREVRVLGKGRKERTVPIGANGAWPTSVEGLTQRGPRFGCTRKLRSSELKFPTDPQARTQVAAFCWLLHWGEFNRAALT